MDFNQTFFPVMFASLLAAGVVNAGEIRHDVSDSSYTSYGAEQQFDGVGDLTFQSRNDNGELVDYRCSGTVIGSRWALTAAHCVDGPGTQGLSFAVGGTTYAATTWLAHENWSGDFTAGYDIALVHFGTDIVGVTIANIFRGDDETGQVGTNVGFGESGTGNEIGYSQTSGTKRAGDNVIDKFGNEFVPGWSSDILLQDFDNPTNGLFTNAFLTYNSMGSKTPLPLEFLISPGDSGGGLFTFNNDLWYLTGVHSFIGTPWAYAGGGDPVYGIYDTFAGSTRVSSYVNWIEENIRPQPVTEPGVLSMMAIGFAMFGFGRRQPYLIDGQLH